MSDVGEASIPLTSGGWDRQVEGEVSDRRILFAYRALSFVEGRTVSSQDDTTVLAR